MHGHPARPQLTRRRRKWRLPTCSTAPSRRSRGRSRSSRRQRLAVEPDAALGQHPPGVRARHAEAVGDRRRQVDRAVGGRHRELLDLLGRSRAARGRARTAPRPPAPPRRRGSAPPAPAPARAWRRAAEVPAGGRSTASSVEPRVHRLVGQRQRAPVHLARRLGDADVVAQRLRHLLHAVDPGQDRHGQHGLLGLAVGALDVAREQQVEGLVGAAELDVGAHGHRVVALHERIEQLEDRDRRPRGPALGEVVALEQLGDGRRARQAEEVLHAHVQPLGVEADLEQLGIVEEHLEGLLLVGAGVGVDLLARQHRARRRAAARIADARGVVAHDQDHAVAQVLELAQLLQHDGVAEVDVRAPSGRGRAWPAAGGPRAAAASSRPCRPPAGQRLGGVARQEGGVLSGGSHRGPMLVLSAVATPCAAWSRPPRSGPSRRAGPPPHERRVRIEHHAAVRRSRAAGATRARSPARQEAPAAGHLPAARHPGHRLDRCSG